MTVLFYDVGPAKTAKGNANATSLANLLEKSDAVTLHVDGRKENFGMCNTGFFSRMKKGAFYLNASRGITYVAEDLREMIESGHLAGAAIDVYQSEPSNGQEIFDHPLIGLSQVILTPHIGGSTEEAQGIIADGTTRRIIKYQDYGWMEQSPMFPGLTFNEPITTGTSRITFLHKNQPGQIMSASSILNRHGINIMEHRTKAHGDFAYANFDVESLSNNLQGEILQELTGLPGALNVRIL
jgi:D-3-phosphoglycerate dehydrogenase